MSNYISHQNGDRYSVANAAEILCFNVTRNDALQALAAKQADPSILDNPAPASEWFGTLLSAFNFTIEDIGSVVDTLPTNETTDELEGKLLDVSDQVQVLAAQIQTDRERAARGMRIAELEQAIERALPELRQWLLANTIPMFDVNNSEQMRAWALNNTEAGQQLARLRRAG